MTDRSEQGSPDRFTRREALKKTAVVVGASVWMTPVVQIVTMRPAFAQTTSGSPPGNGGNGTPNGNGNPPPNNNVTGGDGGPGPVVNVLSETQALPPDTVAGIVVEAPAGTSTLGVTVVAQAGETLPLTGLDADKLGAVAAGLIAGGLAAAQVAKLAERGEEGPADDLEPAT